MNGCASSNCLWRYLVIDAARGRLSVAHILLALGQRGAATAVGTRVELKVHPRARVVPLDRRQGFVKGSTRRGVRRKRGRVELKSKISVGELTEIRVFPDARRGGMKE